MNGISGQTTINATNTTLWHRVGVGFQSVVAGIWRGSTIVAPRVNTTLGVHNNPILSTLATNVTNTTLSFRAAIAGMNVGAMEATTATARAISRTSAALVPFNAAASTEAAIAGMNVGAMGAMTATARAISRTSAALVPFNAAAGTEAVIGGAAAAEAAGAGTIAAETIVAETIITETASGAGAGSAAGSLLGKIAALGKSAWALAAAHPVITATIVTTAIAVSALVIAYRRSQRRNITVLQGGEVPQDGGPDDAS
ncbi:MAG: hypothetical protein LBE98_04495 [Puniceicoccales bacterium]|jgi:hypothetical protein|nr:hypothetical protein [Puniceicoccales bacterium]